VAVAVTFSSTPNPTQLTPEIRAADLRHHITYLASDQMEGRLTGTEGEHRATAYVAAMFQAMGLAPAGDNSTFFQSFEFTAGVSLGGGNQLTAHLSTEPLPQSYTVERERRDRLFAAGSGEELGLLGSTHFTRTVDGTPDEPASLAP
jgi:hypothetical protein